MGMITERFFTDVIWEGHRYPVNAAFNHVLLIQKLYRDERLSSQDKVEQALEILLKRPRQCRRMRAEKRIGLLEQIFSEQISMPPKPPVKGSSQPLVDFELDGEYIYASFLKDYGIDLIEEQGRLHWKRFIALFQGLSDETKIRQVMHIRGMEIPAPTKYNQKEIQNIMELKSYYALPMSGGGGPEGLDRLFKTLEGMAG